MKKKRIFWLLTFILLGLFIAVLNSCKKEDIIKLPKVITLPVTEITLHSAKSGGNITDDGGAEIVLRGVVWKDTPSPSLELFNGKTEDGSGDGIFESSLVNLLPGKTYYVRAYARNEVGTVYGNVIEFNTEKTIPTVATKSITGITSNKAFGGGSVLQDGGVEVTVRGIVWAKFPNPSMELNDGLTENGQGIGSFVSEMINLLPNTTYYVMAYATNIVGTAYGNQIEFKTWKQDGSGGSVFDIDGNGYKTVIIGGKEWMAENLRVTKYNDGTDIPTGLNDYQWESTTDGAFAIYNHNAHNTEGINSPEEMVEAYGKLYNWYAVNDPRGLCPEGWHVPSDDEWTYLVNYLMAEYGWSNNEYDTNGIGNKLKSCRQVDSPLGGDCDTDEHPRWRSHHTHYGNDVFGFSALPAGLRAYFGYTYGISYYAYFWSSTKHFTSYAHSRLLYHDRGWLNSGWKEWKFSNKNQGQSIRCLQDID